MGRFDAISTAIRWLFDLVGVQPRPWMGVAALALLLALAWPHLDRNARTAQARKLVPRALDGSPADRAATQARILDLVAGNPEGLVAVADAALRSNLRPLALEAYTALRALPRARRADVLRLDTALHGERPHHPEQEAAAIERLVEAGALHGAATRCQRARAWFPDDPGLRQLEDRIQAMLSAA